MRRAKHFFELFGEEGGRKAVSPQVETAASGDRTITLRRETLLVAIVFFAAVVVGAFLLGRMTALQQKTTAENYGFACGIWRDINAAQQALHLLKSSGIAGARIGRVSKGYCVVVRGIKSKKEAEKKAQQALSILTRTWTRGLKAWVVGAEE
ncbi:MAG: hypothetical protein DRP63_10020 [Planctomycetota bacterium]|nr:MAG: hypothetical protein DRP63_10020 [Planctomycetota bacterium]